MALTIVSIGRIMSTGNSITFKDKSCKIENKTSKVIDIIPSSLNGLYKVKHACSASVTCAIEKVNVHSPIIASLSAQKPVAPSAPQCQHKCCQFCRHNNLDHWKSYMLVLHYPLNLTKSCYLNSYCVSLNPLASLPPFSKEKMALVTNLNSLSARPNKHPLTPTLQKHPLATIVKRSNPNKLTASGTTLSAMSLTPLVSVSVMPAQEFLLPYMAMTLLPTRFTYTIT